MAKVERPLSPHLQIYKPQISSVLSILHRLTGVALALGTLLFAWWVVAVASGPDAYETVRGFIASFFGRLVLFGFSWALFYHLLNGIRHLCWDAGCGFELRTAARSGWMVVVGSVLLTAITWVIAYSIRG